MRRRSSGREEEDEELQRRRQLQEEQLMKVVNDPILNTLSESSISSGMDNDIFITYIFSLLIYSSTQGWDS